MVSLVTLGSLDGISYENNISACGFPADKETPCPLPSNLPHHLIKEWYTYLRPTSTTKKIRLKANKPSSVHLLYTTPYNSQRLFISTVSLAGTILFLVPSHATLRSHGQERGQQGHKQRNVERRNNPIPPSSTPRKCSPSSDAILRR